MKDNNQNRGKGYHVTIVDNNTGETLEEFDTRGLVYVQLDEIKEEDMPEKKERQIGACGISVGQKMEEVNTIERLSLLEGLQILMQNMQEDDPMLRLLMMITESERRAVTKEDE